MTIQEAWAYGRDQLAQASFTPELDARLLLEYVLRVNHSYLVAHGDEPLPGSLETVYYALLERAAQKEPIPYLIGSSPFYGIELDVNPSVLIPRPETEELVDKALIWARNRPNLQVVDVGTGSGCIAVALSRHLSEAVITAVDISYPALEIARLNASNHGKQPINLLQGNLLESLSGSFDLIAANLPYIADDEWTMVSDGVKWYEPRVALDGGSDGLDLYREMLLQATNKLHPQGAILLEIGWRQGTAVQQLAEELFPYATVEVFSDFASQDRIVQIQSDRSG